MDYDPTQISYKELLRVFWNAHAPTHRSRSIQYKPAIFVHNAEQRQLAEASKAELAEALQSEIFTEILPLTEFYWAENYHQKFRLQQRPNFMNDVNAMYSEFDDIINSTLAARLNGYLGGHGSLELLQAELEQYELSPALKKKLLDMVSHFRN